MPLFVSSGVATARLKKEYRRLALINHPDNGGNPEKMKTINAEYEKAFNRLKDIHNKAAADDTTGKKRKMNETAGEYMEVIQKIIAFSRVAGFARCCSDQLRWRTGIVIELCGSWVWVSRIAQSAVGQQWRSHRTAAIHTNTRTLSRPQASAGHRKRKCGAEVCCANRPKGAPLLVPQAQRSRRNHQPRENVHAGNQAEIRLRNP